MSSESVEEKGGEREAWKSLEYYFCYINICAWQMKILFTHESKVLQYWKDKSEESVKRDACGKSLEYNNYNNNSNNNSPNTSHSPI